MSNVADQSATPSGASAPAPGTAEYDAAMSARADGLSISMISADGSSVTPVGTQPQQSVQDAPPQVEDRPSWLPDKFKSAEELAKAYSELERRQAAPQQQTPQDNQQQAQQNQQQRNTQFDISKYDTEFSANGSLSDASYEELAKAGFNRETVDAYIEGQQARGERYANAGFEVAGGKERYAQMVEWARTNVPRSELAAFNSAVNSMNVEQMKLAVAGLNSRFTAANGVQPTGLMMGSANPVPATGAFQSRSQVVEAMSDPRYQTDPAFRQQVMNKLASSNVF